jgi:hypothetical protein
MDRNGEIVYFDEEIRAEVENGKIELATLEKEQRKRWDEITNDVIAKKRVIVEGRNELNQRIVSFEKSLSERSKIMDMRDAVLEKV